MTNKPKVSVIIPCYNLGKYLDEAVDSVLAQTFQDFEIIIVNDGSTDDFTNNLLAHYKKIKTTVITTNNQGLPSARNNGIQNSSGEYICCLDADDKYHLEFLAKTVPILENDQDKSLGFVTTWVQVFGDDNYIWKTDKYNPNRLAVENRIHVASLFRKSCWEEVGGYATNLTGYQDWNFWIAIASIGYKWDTIEEPLFYYRIRNNSMLKTSDSKRVQLVNQIIENNSEFYRNNAQGILLEYVKLRDSDIVAYTNLNNSFQTASADLERALTKIHVAACTLQLTEATLQQTETKLREREVQLIDTQNQLVDTQHQLVDTQKQLADTQHQLVDTENRLLIAAESVDNFRENLSNSNRALELAQSQLSELRESKTFKLLSIYLDARKSPKMAFLAPFRAAGLFIPPKLLKQAASPFDSKAQASEIITYEERPANVPLISVIIPCFNYGHYVEEAIDSVLNQTFTNIEIIVVDGGSTDVTTIEKLKSIKKEKTTIYYRDGKHLVGDNRNYGIQKSCGKYICCLDADDLLKPTYLEKAVFIAELHNYDIVYPSVQCFGDANHIWAVNHVDFLSCAKGDNISTVALFRRDAWKKVKGYRDYGLGEHHVPEDWEFWVRLLGSGFRAKRLNEPLMLYRVHSSGLTATNRMGVDKQEQIIRQSNESLFRANNLRKLELSAQRRFIVSNPFVNMGQHRSGGVNLLLTLPFMITGGADTVLLQILDNLHSNGFNITCITSIPFDGVKHGDNTSRYQKITREIYHLPDFLEEETDRKNFILYLIESRKIDVVFTVGCELVYHLLPKLKAQFPKLKVVDQLFNEFGHIENNRRYAELIDLNIVATQVIYDVLTKKYGEKTDSVKIIVHGIDVQNTFNPQNVKMLSSLVPRAIPAESQVVGFFGRFSEEKCPKLFVEIIENLKDCGDIFGVMTGGGPEYQEVIEKIQMNRLTNIYAPGIVDDVRPYLSRAHVAVIPSKIEGIPIILMEALSLGIPVVASRVGGMPSIITDGVNGFICESGDVAGFTEKVRLLCSDRELYSVMSRNARSYAEQHLDMAKMNREYLQAFKNVIKN